MKPTQRSASHSRTAGVQKQATCPFCPKRMLKRTLGRHLRSVHHVQDQGRNEKLPEEYSCTQCPMTFARKDKYNRHQSEQHGDKSGLVECMVCGSQVRERVMDIHVKTAKCLKAQHEAGFAHLSRAMQSSGTSLVKPGRFDSSTVIEPLRATAIFEERRAAYLCDANDFYNGSTNWRSFVAFRGLLLRILHRRLDTTDVTESKVLVHALTALMTPERVFQSHKFTVPFKYSCGRSPLYLSNAKLRANGMLIAMRQENLVLAGAINALQARFYHPLIDVKVVAATGTVSNWHIAHFSITDKVVHTVA